MPKMLIAVPIAVAATPLLPKAVRTALAIPVRKIARPTVAFVPAAPAWAVLTTTNAQAASSAIARVVARPKPVMAELAQPTINVHRVFA